METKRISIIDKDGENKLASVVESVSHPGIFGLVIANPDGTPLGPFLKLDQTTPQEITNGIPLLSGLTPYTDYQIATKKYVDDSIMTENLWDRMNNTTLVPHNGGDLLLSYGADTQVQFNDGMVFGGDANFTRNKTTANLKVGNLSNTKIGTHAGAALTTGDRNIIIGDGAGSITATAKEMVLIGVGAGHNKTLYDQDIMIGFNAGYNTTTGCTNIFIGGRAGYSNITGTNNKFIGNAAGYSNISGNQLTFLGDSTGYSNTTGGDNTFIGADVGFTNVDGSENVGVGINALYLNVSGWDNTIIGSNAGYYFLGNENVAIGAFSAYQATGSGNVYLGTYAGFNQTTGDNQFFVDNQDRTSETLDKTNSLMYGIFNSDSSLQILQLGGGGHVGIGTITPTGKLDIQGSAINDLPTYSAEFLLGTGWTSTGWTGDFVTGWTHTTGTTTVLSQSKVAVSWTKYQISFTITGRTAGSLTIGFGGQSIVSITATGAWGPTATSTASLTITPTTDFDGTIIISIKSITTISTSLVNLKSSEGTARIEMRANNVLGNTFIGVGAGSYNTTGNNNTANGYTSLNLNTTGYNNTALGANTLAKNTVGFFNTAIGMNVLTNNTYGNINTAIGGQALYYNTTGSYNLAMGPNALYANTTGNYNLAMGYLALFHNTTGSGNLAMGSNALFSNTTGNYNLAMGSNAGTYIANGSTANTTGDYNIFLGNETKALADDDQNEIVIGYNATGVGSNSVVLGNNSITKTILNGNVGIGTTTPSVALEIGNGGSLKLSGGTANGKGNIQFGATPSNLYDTNLMYLSNTNQTGGFMFGSTPAFLSANGPYFGARGNTYTAIAGQRGVMFISAGKPVTPTGTEGSILLQTQDINRLIVLPNGNVGIGTTAPNSPLHVAGPIATAVSAKTTTYTVTATDSIVTGDATGGAFTITLPTAVGITGRYYTFKKIDSSANAVTIDGAGTETIENSATYVLTAQYKYVTIVSDGAGWIVVVNN